MILFMFLRGLGSYKVLLETIGLMRSYKKGLLQSYKPGHPKYPKTDPMHGLWRSWEEQASDRTQP